MNKVSLLIVVILLGLMSALTSCSQSGKTIQSAAPAMETLRLVDLNSGTPIPVKVSRENNIYKIGDTVWVDYQTKQILQVAPITQEKNKNIIGLGDRILQRMKVEEAPY